MKDEMTMKKDGMKESQRRRPSESTIPILD